MLKRMVCAGLLISGVTWAQPITPGIPLEPIPNSVPESADQREAQFLFDEARRLHRQGQAERALELYRKALQRDSGRLEYRPYLAHALEESGQFAAAVEQYDLYLAQEAGDEQAQSDRLLALVELGRWEDFDRDVARLDASLSGQADFWSVQALAWLRRGQPERALPLLRQAAERAPQRQDIWMNLAATHLQLQQPQEALSVLDGHAQPGAPAWNLLRGSALYQLGRISEAEDVWRALWTQRSAQVVPGGGAFELEAGINLASSLAERAQDREALRVAAEVLDRDPTSVEGKLLYARLLNRAGRYDEAWSELGPTLELPGWAEQAYVRELAGWALLGLRRNPESLEQLNEARRLGASGAALENNLALVLGRLGRLDDALQHQREACRLAPTQASAWYHLGLLLEKKGRRSEARPAYHKFLGLAPRGPAADSLRKRLASWK